jgi:hypothetical protein
MMNGGSRVATLVFGVCLCTITVTTFQLQHKVNSYMGSRVYSSANSDPIIAAVLPQNNDVFAKGTQKLTRHDFDFEQLQKVGSETLQYSLASTLVSIQHPSFSFTALDINKLTILLCSQQQRDRMLRMYR